MSNACKACQEYDYLTCKGCGCHFLTVLKHDGHCFDCRRKA